MKTKSKIMASLIFSTTTLSAIAILNKLTTFLSTSKNILNQSASFTYKWRYGNIHYTKGGIGKPLLLIHDLNSTSSDYEWYKLVDKLKNDYTVYTIDLLGCGCSEKPNFTYTSYLYVQLISDFIKSEIGHRTNVIATGESAALTIMACNNSSELFDSIMLINPNSILSCSQIPGKYSKLYKFILDLPIIGTLLYNISCSKHFIIQEFAKNNLYNPQLLKNSWIDAYHESAHLGKSPKSVFASVKCNYTKCNINNALKKIDNSIYIIGGGEIENINELMNEYKFYNPAIEYSSISKTKYLPQLENPYEVYKLIKIFFN